jgi:hypothetical protein
MRPVERARLRARHWKRRPPIGSGNVVPLRPGLDLGIHMSRAASEISSPSARPFAQLTTARVVDKFRRGVLPEAILIALLAGAGLQT